MKRQSLVYTGWEWLSALFIYLMLHNSVQCSLLQKIKPKKNPSLNTHFSFPLLSVPLTTSTQQVHGTNAQTPIQGSDLWLCLPPWSIGCTQTRLLSWSMFTPQDLVGPLTLHWCSVNVEWVSEWQYISHSAIPRAEKKELKETTLIETPVCHTPWQSMAQPTSFPFSPQPCRYQGRSCYSWRRESSSRSHAVVCRSPLLWPPRAY